jgi:hypothetical protein
MNQSPQGGVHSTPAGSGIRGYFEDLRTKSDEIFASSLAEPNDGKVGGSFLFVEELGLWCRLLDSRLESELLRVAALEYEFAILALAQGHYRHAFKGLRLVLELILQTVFLSVDEIALREWLDNRIHTTWASILEVDEGVFSTRFARAFFPALTPHIKNYRELAAVVYRECSECVHGNIPQQIPLPEALKFDQAVFDMWHKKASQVALIAHFVLALRYLQDCPREGLSALEPVLDEHLGHIEEIRNLLGGPWEDGNNNGDADPH